MVSDSPVTQVWRKLKDSRLRHRETEVLVNFLTYDAT
jgi:hypothetical protein